MSMDKCVKLIELLVNYILAFLCMFQAIQHGNDDFPKALMFTSLAYLLVK